MKKNSKLETPDWPVVLIRHEEEAAEAISYFLFDAGASALVSEDAGPGMLVTTAGFTPQHNMEDLSRRLDLFLDETTDIFSLPEKPEASWSLTGRGDWAEKWKEGLDPIEVGPTLAVKPTWREYEAGPGQAVLEIDPGMAFGTGRHETTLMCLREIEEFFRNKEHQGMSVLDVGAGSGILSLACAALGAGPIVAIDIDPETLPVAEENFALNGFEGRAEFLCGDLEAVKRRFDLVLANITAGDLIPMAGRLAGATNYGGRLVLSGILIEQTDDVLAAMVEAGLVLEKRRDEGEWTSLALIRPGR